MVLFQALVEFLLTHPELADDIISRTMGVLG